MRTLGLVVVTVLLLGACEAGARRDPAGGTAPGGLEWGECPTEIAVTMSGRHRCGTLTVPVVHGAEAGVSMELDVLQVWPPGEPVREGVAVSVGFNFGEPAQEAGLVGTLAERLRVPVVALAPRGVGEAGGIALDCPELDPSGPADPGSFLAATQECRDRLVGEGVDLSAFGVDDVVADLEALRGSLRVDTWDLLMSYGEMARASDRYVAAHAERVRAVVQDSPPAPDEDVVAAASGGTRSALAALFAECRSDHRCASRYPLLDESWQRALDRVAARPVTGAGITVDGPAFLRAIRAMLGGDGPDHVADLPRVVTTAAQGQVHPTLAAVVAGDPDLCNGYRPLCTKPGFSLGAYLSQACPELEPAAVPRERHAAYAEVFERNPYRAACDTWDVPAAPLEVRGPDVPTLVLTGHLNSWSRPEWFEDAVVVPGATHDVSGSSPCVLEARNQWIADPTAEIGPAPCATAPRPHWD